MIDYEFRILSRTVEKIVINKIKSEKKMLKSVPSFLFKKDYLYNMNKKHPFVGTLFSLYIPSTGHLYSDNWSA